MIAVKGLARRRGAVSVTTLLAVPGLLVLGGLVIYVGTLRDARTETQNGADAAALAAARALACDDLLAADPTRAAERISRARSAALLLARANFAHGVQLDLDQNLANDPDGELVFGKIDRPLGDRFEAAGNDVSNHVGDKINAVCVTLRRAPAGAPFGGQAPDREILARSTAMLDWSVVGFRPNNDNLIPIIPIGIFSDHTGALPKTWDAQSRRRDRDEWRFDQATRKWLREADGIPEVTVVIGSAMSEKDVPGGFLQVGVHSLPETVQQLRYGLNREHIRNQFGTGGFVLAEDNALPVPCSRESPSLERDEGKAIIAALRDVSATGEGRIWPLYSYLNEGDGVARVTGWTAARIVACDSVAGGIRLTLQPTVMCHPSAVTEQRHSPPAFCATNRTVCRVRLAE